MTRKHFIAIAKAIKDTQAAADVETTRKVFAERMAALCADANPNFDRAKFLTACGVN